MSKQQNTLKLVATKDELSLIEDNSLNEKQLGHLLKKTPDKYKRTRPAKGGGTWTYVTGGYVKKVLNLMFGWDWDFEILNETVYSDAKEVVVRGRLTIRSNGSTIIKTQYGNKDIICKRGTDIPLSIGNDLKSAATDCLKKCASEIGIAADIYNAEEFREITVTEVSLEIVEKLFKEKRDKLSPDDEMNIERIIEQKEEGSYKKAITELNKL